MKKTAQLVLAVILLISSFSLLKSVVESYQKMDSLGSAQDQIKSLREKNERLKAEAEYRQSSFYIEKTARDNLGLGKNGETVLIVTQAATNSAQADKQISKTNLQTWLDLFFN